MVRESLEAQKSGWPFTGNENHQSSEDGRSARKVFSCMLRVILLPCFLVPEDAK